MSIKKVKVSRDVAVNDLIEFLKVKKAKAHRRESLSPSMVLKSGETLEESYIDAIDAIEDGLLTFDENMRATYKLRFPLYEGSEHSISEVNFRERIKRANIAEVVNGLDPKREGGTYLLKLISYCTQLSMADVKNLEDDDFDTLNQICSVFQPGGL